MCDKIISATTRITTQSKVEKQQNKSILRWNWREWKQQKKTFIQKNKRTSRITFEYDEHAVDIFGIISYRQINKNGYVFFSLSISLSIPVNIEKWNRMYKIYRMICANNEHFQLNFSLNCHGFGIKCTRPPPEIDTELKQHQLCRIYRIGWQPSRFYLSMRFTIFCFFCFSIYPYCLCEWPFQTRFLFDMSMTVVVSLPAHLR